MLTLIKPLVQAYLDSEAGQKMIEDRVTKLVASALDTATSYNTEFKKALDAAVAESLGLPSGVDLPSYNHTILAVVQRQVEALHEGAITKQVAERMKDLLRPVPASIKLSDLVEQFRQHCHEKASAGCSCDGESEITVIRHDSGGGFIYYGLDEDTGKKLNSCDIRFGVYNGELFSLTFDNANVEKQLFVGPFHGFERMLFQMRAAQSKIEIDGEPDDFSKRYGPSYD